MDSCRQHGHSCLEEAKSGMYSRSTGTYSQHTFTQYTFSLFLCRHIKSHPCSFIALLTLACLISSSAISMRFFLKATTRLPLKLVSSTRTTQKRFSQYNLHFTHKKSVEYMYKPFFPDSESLSNFCRHCCWCSSAWGTSLLFRRALSSALLEFS